MKNRSLNLGILSELAQLSSRPKRHSAESYTIPKISKGIKHNSKSSSTVTSTTLSSNMSKKTVDKSPENLIVKSELPETTTHRNNVLLEKSTHEGEFSNERSTCKSEVITERTTYKNAFLPGNYSHRNVFVPGEYTSKSEMISEKSETIIERKVKYETLSLQMSENDALMFDTTLQRDHTLMFDTTLQRDHTLMFDTTLQRDQDNDTSDSAMDVTG